MTGVIYGTFRSTEIEEEEIDVGIHLKSQNMYYF